MKTPVAYFSPSGEATRLAKTITQAAGADLHEIRSEQPYTATDLNWHDDQSRSSMEMRDPACRPTIAGDAPDLMAYDTVFVPHLVGTGAAADRDLYGDP